jgi:hypothetical protein
LDDYNFGIVYIPIEDYENFWQMLWWFLPEIGIIISTLILIQKETLAGIFNVSLSDYESFTDGLQRKAAIIVESSEKAKESFLNIEILWTLRENL